MLLLFRWVDTLHTKVAILKHRGILISRTFKFATDKNRHPHALRHCLSSWDTKMLSRRLKKSFDNLFYQMSKQILLLSELRMWYRTFCKVTSSDDKYYNGMPVKIWKKCRLNWTINLPRAKRTQRLSVFIRATDYYLKWDQSSSTVTGHKHNINNNQRVTILISQSCVSQVSTTPLGSELKVTQWQGKIMIGPWWDKNCKLKNNLNNGFSNSTLGLATSRGRIEGKAA